MDSREETRETLERSNSTMSGACDDDDVGDAGDDAGDGGRIDAMVVGVWDRARGRWTRRGRRAARAGRWVGGDFGRVVEFECKAGARARARTSSAWDADALGKRRGVEMVVESVRAKD